MPGSVLDCAVQYGDSQTAELLISQGVDVNTQSAFDLSYKATWLHFAVARNDVEVIETLIAQGANVNTNQITPLHWAVLYGGSREAAELLIQHGSQVEPDILNSITSRTNPDIVDLLIAEGADINAKDQDGFTPLHTAARYRDVEISKHLLAHGAEPNVKISKPSDGSESFTEGFTPLYIALDKMNRVGSYHDENGKRLSTKRQRRQAALRREQRFAELLETFLQYGADIDAQTVTGKTLLYTAADWNRLDLVQLLVNKGADSNLSMNKFSEDDPELYRELITPLHIAIRLNSEPMARILIDAGADVNAKTPRGYTSLTLMRDQSVREQFEWGRRNRPNSKLEKLLVEHEAK